MEWFKKKRRTTPYQQLRDEGVLTARDLIFLLQRLDDHDLDMPVLIPTEGWYAYITTVQKPDENEGYSFPTLIEAARGFDPRDL